MRYNLIYRDPLSLEGEVQWSLKYCRGKTFSTKVYKLPLVVVIYHIWGEMNKRIFKSKREDYYSVCRKITNAMKAKMYK